MNNNKTLRTFFATAILTVGGYAGTSLILDTPADQELQKARDCMVEDKKNMVECGVFSEKEYQTVMERSNMNNLGNTAGGILLTFTALAAMSAYRRKEDRIFPINKPSRKM